MFKKELSDFAKKSSQNGFDFKIKEAVRIESQLKKELAHLEKEKEKLNNDIESWKASINKAENQILNNDKQQEAKKVEISTQTQAVQALRLEKGKI